MNYFGLASPFTMASTQFDDEASYSSSSSSSHSSSSYSSQQQHFVDSESDIPIAPESESYPSTTTDYDHHHYSASSSDEISPPTTVDPASPAVDHLLPPLSPPPNSFASAQAAMAAQNSSHSQNLIGHCIDNSTKNHASRLEFVSILGLGAYGVVYLARDILARPSAFPSSRAHPSLGNQPLYAVKCLNKVGLDARQRSFQCREIALHTLASPHGNVVTLHNVIEEETCIYVVLQFCEEGDLFGMITERQRYLGNDELIRSVFLQIVDSVEFCHNNSIYHRDLKPENILCLDDGKKVVLADFGLATHEKTSGDFGCGSTFYMSPECQGGLFQRLGSYSTPHNDIWSLGVILVNLTCGRNPWKQACPSDETFCAYLGNPDFLRSILPISDHTNRILKRIFALNPQARISLKDLRKEILSVKTFVMSEDELRNATRATKEAARAFAQGVPEPQHEEVEEYEDDLMVQSDASFTSEDDFSFSSPPISPFASQAPVAIDEDKTPSPVTPTQPPRRVAPITPPATPRRNAPPALKSVGTALKSCYSDDRSSSGESSDTLASDDDTPSQSRGGSPRTRRRRQEVYSTPPQQARSAFGHDSHIYHEDSLPPSPVTPTNQHRRPRAAATRSGSPRSAARNLKANGSGGSSSRRRKTSVDSSSSSSGNSSSQPPTPTGLPPYGSHSVSTAGSLDIRLANQVHIVDSNSPVLHQDGDYSMALGNSSDNDYLTHPSISSSSSHSSKNSITAYYPIFADWADACSGHQSHYDVTLPPDVVITTDGSEPTAYDFPLPPSTGHYTRTAVAEGEIPMVDIHEAR